MAHQEVAKAIGANHEELTMIDQTAAEIEAMHTHSSSEVAVKAAQALRELLDREYATVAGLQRDFEHNTGVLRRANPSHASLENALREIETTVLENEYASTDAAKAALDQAITETVTQIERATDEAAAAAATLLEDGDRILTHDFSTTVIEALRRAAADGRELEVVVAEARPRYLGRKTARQLAEIDGIDTTLIVDAAAGHHLRECDRVLIGMTCVVDDILYNRVGTYPIVATANNLDVPVAVAGASSKVIENGFVFENDFRNASEVLREPADGFSVSNPAYDATPLALIDRLITEREVTTPVRS